MARVWFNGKLVLPSEACIDPTDRGLLLGDGLFETVLARDGQIAFLDQHLDRLARGAATLRLPLLDRAVLAQALRATVTANAPTGTVAVRLTVTRGVGGRGLSLPEPATPTVLITCSALPPASGPARLIISDFRRNETSPLSAVKSLAYLDAVMARAEAADAGADDAVLRNSVGNLVCASAANLFAVVDGTLVTPPQSDGPLPGIVRALVLQLAADAGLPVREASLPLGAIDGASEIFLTNSLTGLRPVAAVDNQQIAACPGPMTIRLTKLYEQALDWTIT